MEIKNTSQGIVLADNAEIRTSLLRKMRGLMFRRSIPDDYGLVFEFGKSKKHSVHMLFVPFPLDVVWIVDGVVQGKKTLRPWIGIGAFQSDTIIELPAGTGDDIEVGDEIQISE